MDRDEWQLAFEPFEGHAYAALKLGVTLARLRMYLDGQLFKSRPVMDALDEAMEVLSRIQNFTMFLWTCLSGSQRASWH